MKCPECGGELRISSTKERVEGEIRRRRECLVCGHKFSTVEITAQRYEDLLEAAGIPPKKRTTPPGNTVPTKATIQKTVDKITSQIDAEEPRRSRKPKKAPKKAKKPKFDDTYIPTVDEVAEATGDSLQDSIKSFAQELASMDNYAYDE